MASQLWGAVFIPESQVEYATRRATNDMLVGDNTRETNPVLLAEKVDVTGT